VWQFIEIEAGEHMITFAQPWETTSKATFSEPSITMPNSLLIAGTV
jgi:hypothetical protein